jgi:hypothetical protein
MIFVSANAKELVELKAKCSKEHGFVVFIDSLQLYLSEDAVIDNLGGYVDIFDAKYYIKTPKKVYTLEGEVINIGTTHRFTSTPSMHSKAIDAKELYSLKDTQQLRFIQKIRLEKTDKVVRVDMGVDVDIESFDILYKMCINR